jgi:FHS family L-fucose permease-like MFS transporter
VAGLTIAAAGCALFYPAATSGYTLFLIAFFVLAGGITILQVAANPYVAVLGDPRTASSRLTLTQAFNSLGTTVAPALGGMLIWRRGPECRRPGQAAGGGVAAYHAKRGQRARPLPGAGCGAAGAGHPVRHGAPAEDRRCGRRRGEGGYSEVLKHRHLALGVMAIFLYVGGEVSIGSFLINFLGDPKWPACRRPMPRTTSASTGAAPWSAASSASP